MNSVKNNIFIKSDDFNSQTAYLSSVALKNGEKVSNEQIIAVIETSKKVIEVVSTFEGHIYFYVEEGESFDIKEPLAFVSPELLKRWDKSEKKVEPSSVGFTLKGKSLAARFGIKFEDFSRKTIIKEEDVLNYLKSKNIEIKSFETQFHLAEENLSPNTYTSCVSVAFDFGLLQKRIKHEKEKLKSSINADALFSFATHSLLKKYELLSSYMDGSELILLKNCPVGIYISDENKKGSTYVLNEFDLKTLASTAERAYEIYRNYLNNDVEENVQRSAFIISNMMNLDIQSLQPMLKKGTVATLGLASADRHGDYLVTLAFDHRFFDGGYAARFLNELKVCIEKF